MVAGIMQLNHPNREKAKLANETQYFTGIECKNKHMANRWVVNGSCVDCCKTIKSRHKQTSKYKQTTKTYSKNYKPKLIYKLYGLSENDYSKMLAYQNFKCKLCDNQLDAFRKTHIDHCHETKKVRGILCAHCNLGLGHLKHNPELLRKAALYCEQA